MKIVEMIKYNNAGLHKLKRPMTFIIYFTMKNKKCILLDIHFF